MMETILFAGSFGTGVICVGFALTAIGFRKRLRYAPVRERRLERRTWRGR